MRISVLLAVSALYAVACVDDDKYDNPRPRPPADAGTPPVDGGSEPPFRPVRIEVFGGFNRDLSSNISNVPGWGPDHTCQWGYGVVASQYAAYEGTTGLSISDNGCRVESIPFAIPVGASAIRFDVLMNIWGLGCPSSGCVQVEFTWFDASGVRVGTEALGIPRNGDWRWVSIDAVRPSRGTSVIIAFTSYLPNGQGVYLDDARLTAY